MKKIDIEDLKMMKSIAEKLQHAADIAEKESERIFNQRNTAYEFGFLKGYVETLGMELESILNKK